MKTDIQIARECEMKPIEEIAKRLGIDESDLELYGKYKAKLSAGLWDKIKNREDGKLVLVTAITPTPAGEGKTTVSVGLGQALCRAGKNAVVALRRLPWARYGHEGGRQAAVFASRPMGGHRLHSRATFMHNCGKQPAFRDDR